VNIIYRQLLWIYRFKHDDKSAGNLFDDRNPFRQIQRRWEAAFICLDSEELGTHEQYVNAMPPNDLLYDTGKSS